jgi:outer membrane receptor protein involved in Fe transport
LGATYQKAFDGVLSNIALTADGYYNNIRNKIIYLPTRSPLTPSVTNLGRVDITGVDVTAKADFKPAPNWRANFSATYTYQNAVDVTNPTDSYYLQQIPYTPKNLLTLDAGFSYKRIGMYYNCIISSSRYFESDNVAQYYLAGYNVSNLSFNYSLLTQRHPLNIAFNINNLFNTSYVIVHSYPMPGLSYRISMQITI